MNVSPRTQDAREVGALAQLGTRSSIAPARVSPDPGCGSVALTQANNIASATAITTVPAWKRGNQVMEMLVVQHADRMKVVAVAPSTLC